MIKNNIKKALNSIGYDIVKYPFGNERVFRDLFRRYEIDLVFDIGANEGQYRNYIRSFGYSGNIVSFEPLSSSFKKMLDKSKYDKYWIVRNIALGEFDGEVDLNIASNFVSSSILEMLSEHITIEPCSKYLGKERAKIYKLDSIFSDYYQLGNRVFVKIDTQGYEKKILDGAKESLANIKGLQLEMSIHELYKGEMLLGPMLNHIHDIGFSLCCLMPAFIDKETGRLMQVDGIFFRVT